MPPTPIPWPTNALPGRRPGEGQGDLLNAYASKRGDVVEIRQTPGLTRLLTLASPNGRTPRGMLMLNDKLLHAWDGALYIRTAAGVDTTAIGALTGTDRVFMAANVRVAGSQIALVDSLGAFSYDLTTNTLAAYPDGDLGAVTTVEYFSGYFVFTRTSGEIVASDLQQLAINPLSTARAEYSNDLLLRVKNGGSSLLAFGSRTIEVWQDVASSPFPFARQTTIDVGLFGMHAVAGGANEWEHGILFVASDATVRMLDGFNPRIVSHDDVVADIMDYRTTPDLVHAQVYTFGQQAMFSISTPTWTWEFNAVSGGWNRRDSAGLDCWRCRYATFWRNRWYAQDLLGGHVQEIDIDRSDEDEAVLRFRVDSGALKEFPAFHRTPEVHIDVLTGGTFDAEADPVVMVSWSHDGGMTYGNPVQRSLGRVGKPDTLVTVRNLGRSSHQGLRLRVEVVDRVKVTLRGAISTRHKGARPKQVA